MLSYNGGISTEINFEGCSHGSLDHALKEVPSLYDLWLPLDKGHHEGIEVGRKLIVVEVSPPDLRLDE